MAGSPQQYLTRELGKAVEYFKPQYNELAQQEAKSYKLIPETMQQFNKMRNNGVFQNEGVLDSKFTGISPMDALGVGMGRIGENFATSDALSRGIDFQRGRLETIISDLLGQYSTEQARRAAASSGGYGGGYGSYGSAGGSGGYGLGGQTLTPSQQAATIGRNALATGAGRVSEALNARDNSLSANLARMVAGAAQVASPARLLPGNPGQAQAWGNIAVKASRGDIQGVINEIVGSPFQQEFLQRMSNGENIMNIIKSLSIKAIGSSNSQSRSNAAREAAKRALSRR